MKYAVRVLGTVGAFCLSSAVSAENKPLTFEFQDNSDAFWHASEEIASNDLLQQPLAKFVAAPARAFERLSARLHKLCSDTVVLPELNQSFFPESKLYQAVTLPFASVSRLERGYQLEVIGQFYDQDKYHLMEIAPDSVMFDYAGSMHSEDMLDTNLGLGLGASFLLDDDVTLQTLYTSGSIPQYGGAKLAIGIEVDF